MNKTAETDGNVFMNSSFVALLPTIRNLHLNGSFFTTIYDTVLYLCISVLTVIRFNFPPLTVNKTLSLLSTPYCVLQYVIC